MTHLKSVSLPFLLVSSLFLVSTLSLLASETQLLVEARDAKTGESVELRSEDFELLEDGNPVDVLTIQAPNTAWRALIYFDPAYGSRRGLASAARDLASEARRLSALGWVEVQMRSEVWLGPTRDSQLVHAILEQVADHLSSLPLSAFERPTSHPPRPVWLERPVGAPSALIWPLDDLGSASSEQIRKWVRQATIQGWTLIPIKYLSTSSGETTSGEITVDTLSLFEESTAGTRILNPLSLGPVLQHLGLRRWVTYSSPSSSEDGARRIKIRSRREGLLVRTPLWTPEHRLSERWISDHQALSQPIQLAPFQRPLVAGRVRVEPLVLSSEVETVTLLLDGRPVDTTHRPDFAAWVRFENLPSPQVLEAVAKNAAGTKLGRDQLAVNVGSNRFETRIVAPETLTTAGIQGVVVEVQTPAGRRTKKVEIYWGEKQLHTFSHPPFEKNLQLPKAQGAEYLRAVSTLDDGRTSEDARLSGSGFGERTEVDLVELHAVVVGPDGPVKDLSQSRFRLSEKGRDLELRFFGTAANVPLNLGMAMDISFSMDRKMEVVRRAALGFLSGLLRPVDHTLLTTFQSRPVLARPLTSNLELMSRAIADVEAGGATALYDALMYSLIELRGLSGRKALVMLTHGGDQESRFNARQCGEFAQRFGIPVYVIAIAGLRDTQQFKDLSSLRRIARVTGGAYFFIKKVEELDGAYTEIAEYLSSQYVFAFQPNPPARSGGKPAWHPLTLKVEDPGLEVRTADGYFLASSR